MRSADLAQAAPDDATLVAFCKLKATVMEKWNPIALPPPLSELIALSKAAKNH
jgi:hypothetical protein